MISSHVAADILTSRRATLLRVFGVGRLVILWDTKKPVPERTAGF